MAKTASETDCRTDRKRKLSMPGGIVIVIAIAIFACVLTYVVPAGNFIETVDPTTGENTIAFENFEYIEQTPVDIWEIPYLIVEGAEKVVNVLLIYFTSGGAIMVVLSSGAVEAVINRMIRRFKNRRKLLIVIFTGMFGLFSLVLMPQAFVAFAPVMVMLARRMGYDAITGISMIMLGSAVSYSTGPFGTSTAVAQSIVGLPLLSGFEYRLISLVVLLIPTLLYLIWYSERVRKDIKKSCVYEIEEKYRNSNNYDKERTEDDKITVKRAVVLVCLALAMAIMVIGTLIWNWGLREYAAVYIVLAIVAGFAGGKGLSKTSVIFVKGTQTLVGAAIITVIAYTVTLILTNGNILDTVVYSFTKTMLALPPFLYAPAMFIMQTLINIVIVSGGGQAMVTMPIMSSVSTLLGMPMQSAVLAFNFGDGLCNYILPHSAQCISFVEAVNVPFQCWLKFIIKLFAMWIVICMILMYISTLIWS